MDQKQNQKNLYILLSIIGIFIISLILITSINNYYSIQDTIVTQDVIVGGLTFKLPSDYELIDMLTDSNYQLKIFDNGDYVIGIGVYDSKLANQVIEKDNYTPRTISKIKGYYQHHIKSETDSFAFFSPSSQKFITLTVRGSNDYESFFEELIKLQDSNIIP